MHRTLKEVCEHLQDYEGGKFWVNEQSARRMLNKMVAEGLLNTFGRGEKNAIIYTKTIFSNQAWFKTFDGEVAGLENFIRHVDDLEWPVFSDEAMRMIKTLIIQSLASAYPEPYVNKGKTPVAPSVVRQELKTLLNGLSRWTIFLKNFLEAPVWTDFQREQLAAEFKTDYANLHAALVDRKDE